MWGGGGSVGDGGEGVGGDDGGGDDGDVVCQHGGDDGGGDGVLLPSCDVVAVVFCSCIFDWLGGALFYLARFIPHLRVSGSSSCRDGIDMG